MAPRVSRDEDSDSLDRTSTQTRSGSGGSSTRSSSQNERIAQRWSLGIFFIVLVSLIWACSSIVVQRVTHELDFDRPFAITYIGASLFTVYLPMHTISAWMGIVEMPPMRSPAARYRELQQEDEGGEHKDAPSQGLPQSVSDQDTRPDGETPLKSHFFLLKLGLMLAPWWFTGEWLYNVSLADTSVTSSTIISNSSALFTFVFNVLYKSESFTPAKAMGVAMAVLGAIAVGLGDRAGRDSLLGDVAAIISALLYGVHVTMIRLYAPSDEEVVMPLVLGYMGVVIGTVLMPVLLGLALAPGILELQGLSWNLLKLLIAKALVDNVFASMLWARAVLLTTPTVATVGCSLTIPFAFLSDFLLHGKKPNLLAVLGAFLVVGAFVFVSQGGPASERMNARHAPDQETPAADVRNKTEEIVQ